MNKHTRTGDLLADAAPTDGAHNLPAVIKPGKPETEAEFDWASDDSVLLNHQPATAVYFNRVGDLVIRQERCLNEEEDTFITISPQNIATFVDNVVDAAGIPSFGGPPPSPPPVRGK